MKQNILLDKTYSFALEIVKIYKELCVTQKEYVLSKQLLRSGTSIGANLEEALGGYSDKGFAAKLSIVYKESREAHYWLRILKDSDFLEPEVAERLLQQCEKIFRITYKSLTTFKANRTNT